MGSQGMASGSSDHWSHEVHRLFHFGAVGTMSDAQLLDQIVSRRDEAAEAAFEELVIRHGPMVLRVCRSVLHDAHDAEDAFQAVFLVLANRAGSIRRGGSVASWLFGVAHRVASRARRGATRQRRLNRLVAERTTESYVPVEEDPDRDILHEEIQALPARLRAPVVLCYLEGLTHAAAAHQLGLSEVTIRGRVARARERLRHRLTRRGLTVPAGLLAAGAASQAEAAIPLTLTHSTIRIALGFIAGNTAAILARGVLNSMLLNQLRVAILLLCLGIGGSYWAWRAFASAGNGPGQAIPSQSVVRVSAPTQPPRTDRYGDPLPSGAAMRLGTVRFRQEPFIKQIVYSPDGQLVVTHSGQHTLVVWNATDGKTLSKIEVGIEEIWDFAFSPDGKTVAAVGFQLEPSRNVVVNHLVIADVATGRLVRRCEWDDQDNVQKVAYGADDKSVATVSLDGTLRLWDVATSKIQRQERLVGEEKLSPESIAFSPAAANRQLAVAGRRALELWDVMHLRRVWSIAVDRRTRPDGLVFSPDGTVLAGGEAQGGSEILLWRVEDGKAIGRFKSPSETVAAQAVFSPDGKALAAIKSGGSLVFFDAATGTLLNRLSDVRIAGFPLAFSPNGTTLATTGMRQTLHFWDLATGKDRLATPEAHQGDVIALFCLADGKTLVSGSRDRTVRIWDLATGRSTRMLPLDGWVVSVSVSADGTFLAAGSSYPAKIELWNLKSGERLPTWTIQGTKPAPQMLRGMTLSEGGSAVIAAVADGSLRQWDIATGQERPIARPKLEKVADTGPAGGAGLDNVNRAVFSRDGQAVALMGHDWVQVFDVAGGDRRFKTSAARVVCGFASGGGSLAIAELSAAKKFRAGNWSGSEVLASTIHWLDSHSGDVRRQIEIPDSSVFSLAFSPDEQMIAVATVREHPARGIIRIFRLRDKREIQTIEAPCYGIEALCFTPDGKQIIAGLRDTSIVIWDVRPTR